MSIKAIYINNNPISDAFIVEESDNLIICKEIKEEFFGIASIKIENDSIICEQVKNDIVKVNVRIGEEEFKDVVFKIVVEPDEKPRVAININNLKNPTSFIKDESINHILFEEAEQEENGEYLPAGSALFEEAELKENNSLIIEQLNSELEKIKKINEKKVKAKTVEVTNKLDQLIEEKVYDYKNKLLKDLFDVIHDQETVKNAAIKNTADMLEESFDNKYEELSIVLEDKVVTLTEQSKEKLYDKLQTYRDVLREEITQLFQDFSDISKIETNNNLKEKIQETKKILSEKNIEDIEVRTEESKKELYDKLQSYNDVLRTEIGQLFEDFEYASKIETNKNLKEKIQETEKILSEKNIEDIEVRSVNLKKEVFEQIELIDEKIEKFINLDKEQLVEEAAKILIEKDPKNSGKLKKIKDQLLKDLQKSAEKYTADANKRMMRYAEMMSGGGSNAVQYANGGTMNGNLNVNGKYLSGGVDFFSIFSTGASDSQTLIFSEPNSTLTISNGNTVSLSALNDKTTISNYLPLSGGIITGNLGINNDLTVYGSLTALGNITYIDTSVIVTSSVDITNYGTGPGLLVKQYGAQPVARFIDKDNEVSLSIEDTGKVVIGNTIPSSELLTIHGGMSAKGNIYANGHLTVHTLQASVKNFCIPHPSKEGKNLIYSSLESPYIGVQLTGEGVVKQGKCQINLPEYIKELIHFEDVHIQITNFKHSRILFIDNIDIKNNKFEVKAEGFRSLWEEYRFFWLLTGVRKDVPRLVTEI